MLVFNNLDIYDQSMANNSKLADKTHCPKLVVQTNLPSIGKTHIFRTGMKSTFTWTMPYKSISVLIIT